MQCSVLIFLTCCVTGGGSSHLGGGGEVHTWLQSGGEGGGRGGQRQVQGEAVGQAHGRLGSCIGQEATLLQGDPELHRHYDQILQWSGIQMRRGRFELHGHQIMKHPQPLLIVW